MIFQVDDKDCFLFSQRNNHLGITCHEKEPDFFLLLKNIMNMTLGVNMHNLTSFTRSEYVATVLFSFVEEDITLVACHLEL